MSASDNIAKCWKVYRKNHDINHCHDAPLEVYNNERLFQPHKNINDHTHHYFLEINEQFRITLCVLILSSDDIFEILPITAYVNTLGHNIYRIWFSESRNPILHSVKLYKFISTCWYIMNKQCLLRLRELNTNLIIRRA